MGSVSQPAVKSYLNIHDYLKDLYTFKKSQNSKFSYETWARELGIQNKSFLRQIVVGRRSLTETTIESFCQSLNLSRSDREYFHLLVMYSRARSSEQRDLYGRKLRQLVRLDYAQEPIAHDTSFVLKTLFPRLQTLLSFMDLERTPESLSKYLGCSLGEVQGGLETLKELELAEPLPVDLLGKIQWRSRAKSFKVPDTLGSQALLDYHESVLKEAIQARHLDPKDRRYRSLLVALSEDDFNEFLKDLEIFVKGALHKFDSEELGKRKLFQLNFNLHAVSSSL